MRADPVPLAPRSDRDGYRGGTPSTTYRALLRIALDDNPDLVSASTMFAGNGLDGQPSSQLWTAISTTKGPLRLSWPQVKLWARADAKHGRGRKANQPDRNRR